MTCANNKFCAPYICNEFVNPGVRDDGENIIWCLSIELENKSRKRYVILRGLNIFVPERCESHENALKTFMYVGKKRKKYWIKIRSFIWPSIKHYRQYVLNLTCSFRSKRSVKSPKYFNKVSLLISLCFTWTINSSCLQTVKGSTISIAIRSHPLIERVLGFHNKEDGFEEESHDTGSNLHAWFEFWMLFRWSTRMCDVIFVIPAVTRRFFQQRQCHNSEFL